MVIMILSYKPLISLHVQMQCVCDMQYLIRILARLVVQVFNKLWQLQGFPVYPIHSHKLDTRVRQHLSQLVVVVLLC